MGTISSNGFSHDQQVQDAMDWLELNHPDAYTKIVDQFPETPVMSGSWLDTEAMQVDAEWSSWLTDAIEETGLVVWEEGEPRTVPPGERVIRATADFDVTEAWECWRIEITTDLPVEKITPEWLANNPNAWEFLDLHDRGYASLQMTQVEDFND